jgi:glutaredoxin
MTLSATVLSQPNCAGCNWVKKTLDQHGVEYTELDVTTDAAAEVMLRALYDTHRRGQHPATPVTMLSTPQGVQIVFGPDIRDQLRRHTRAAAAA